MIYIERDSKGEIISLRRTADKPGMECKTAMDAEILKFFDSIEDSDVKFQLLASSDAAISRILEDVIDLLVSKNLIMFTELPEEAQKKIQARKQIRQGIEKRSIIVDGIL